MKKLYSLFCLIFPLSCVLFLISCEDILQEEPKSISAEYFYNTSGEVETAVNAIYQPIRGYNGFGFLYPAQLTAYEGEYYHGRGSYSSLSDFQGLNSTNITRVGNIWVQFYSGIRNANLVIKNAPEGTNISETDIAKYVAEAKFMRAFIYFQIVRNWNKAVLRTELNMTELDVPISSADDVYALIVSDLEYAEQNLPDEPSISGHPSKWSAKTVLADVYLNRENYAEAMNKAGEVIQSKKYSLVEVSTYEDFDKIFGADVVNSTEEIFYLKYSRESGWAQTQCYHHPKDPYYNGFGLFILYMPDSETNDFYNNQDNADLRKKLWYPWEFGLGLNTMLSRKFVDTERLTYGGNDYPFYRYADLLFIYSEAVSKANGSPTVDAMEKLNMVHRRAYGYNSLIPSVVDFKLADYSDIQSFMNVLLEEKGYETVDEVKRWLDLKRLGLAKEKIKAATGIDIAEKHMWWPIPVSEMNFNKAIDPVADQNPGY